MKLIFAVDKAKDYNTYTNSIEFYSKYTMLSGMYGIVLNNRLSEPKEYDKAELESVLNNSNTEKKTNLGKPNIIIVFSEAFFDTKHISEVTFDKDITCNFNVLEEKGKKISMISSSYGGMSENVAFELLTGGSMNYFP